jgi:branched-chain amino acid transport system permease protein
LRCWLSWNFCRTSHCLLCYIGLYSMVALGLVMLTGVGGMTSFGQAAFVGMAPMPRPGSAHRPQLCSAGGLFGMQGLPWLGLLLAW